MLAILAVGSLLAASAFLMARLEVQSGENGLNAARALEAAESGLSEIVAWWDPVQYNQLSPGGSLAIPSRTLPNGGYTGKLTRLSAALFLVEVGGWSQARANLPIARRILRSIVRLPGSSPWVGAALTVVDTLSWDAQSLVSGSDTIPPGWGGSCVLDSAVAGLVTPPGAQIGPGSCPTCFSGVPPISTDSTLSLASLTSFGTGGFAGLAARAAHTPGGIVGTVAPRVSGMPAVCFLADSLNWGEPLRSGPFAACGGYHPVIHAPGDVSLTGGRGQGILLVDGNLELGGGFEFTGVVIVLGTLRNGPGGGSVIGAVLTRNVYLDGSLPGSLLRIHYSACVLPNTTRGSSQATPLPYRSWAQSF